MSYAIKWREPGGQAFSGHVELGLHALTLHGRDELGSVSRVLPYEDVRSYRIGRGEDGLEGRPALVLEHRRTACWLLQPTAALGMLQELAHLFASKHGAQPHLVSGRQTADGIELDL